jgi:hypothetical protein
MHLLFVCAQCSEPLWELAEEANTALISASRIAQTFYIHAYSAIYNIYDGQVPQRHAGQITSWFQEIKRDLIYCRFKRSMGIAIKPARTRLLGYVNNALGCMVS